ncbi:MAG: WD40 repeat domain-containing protein [Chloroflexi bacterium]|nr:WD40 repeat domain-containing protein [Chloroflexota bacterium]
MTFNLFKKTILPIVISIFISSAYVTNAGNLGAFHESTIFGRGVVTNLAWRPDGLALAVASERGIWLYSENLEDISFWATPTRIQEIYWHPSQNEIISIDENDMVSIWDVLTGEQISQLDTEEFTVGAWSPLGDVFALGTSVGTVLIYDRDLRKS